MDDTVKVFNFGGCDLWAALRNKFIMRECMLAPLMGDKKLSFNFTETCHPIQSPSIISLFTDPGLIANRVVEEFTKIKNPAFPYYGVYNEIVKFPYLQYWKDNAGPRDILVMNLSSEFYNRFDNGKEYFTLVPAFKELEHVDWIRNELIQSNKFHVMFDAREIHDRSKDYIREFAKQVHDIFKDRVILVGTHFTDKIIVNNNMDIKALESSMLQVNYYSDTKLGADQQSLEYAQDFSNLICRYFRHRYKSDIPYLTIPKEFVFMDLYHPYGVTPFHLHDVSIRLLSSKILDEIKIIKAKYNSQGVINVY